MYRVIEGTLGFSTIAQTTAIAMPQRRPLFDVSFSPPPDFSNVQSGSSSTAPAPFPTLMLVGLAAVLLLLRR